MRESKSLRRVVSALLIAMLMLAVCAPALADSFKVKVNSSSARVYNVPSTSSSVSVRAVKGTTVTVTAYANGWARISYKGYTGYMQIKYLNLVDRIKAYTGKSTPVYKQDSSSSSKLGTLSIGTAVYVVGVSGDYCRVQNKSGSVTGYVKSDNLTTKAALTAAYNAYKKAQEKKSSSSSSATNLEKAVALAVSYVGRPYAISDNPPSSFNCSSLVEYCLERYGYSMQGTAAAQAADSRYERISSTSSLRTGDVLCFDTDEDGTVDHTALYIGSSKFVEASQSAGKVQTNTLDSWYKSHFVLARRPS